MEKFETVCVPNWLHENLVKVVPCLRSFLIYMLFSILDVSYCLIQALWELSKSLLMRKTILWLVVQNRIKVRNLYGTFSLNFYMESSILYLYWCQKFLFLAGPCLYSGISFWNLIFLIGSGIFKSPSFIAIGWGKCVVHVVSDRKVWFVEIKVKFYILPSARS